MRKIVKTHSPRELEQWKKDNPQFNNDYNCLVGTKAHKILKRKLLKEQGYLCAYTGISLHDDTSHVEHLHPEKLCEEWEDVDYRNLVACFPKSGGDVLPGYGAPIKGCWWDEALFLSPLSEKCERAYIYTWDGKMKAANLENKAADATIKHLGLDSKNIRHKREKSIMLFFGFGKDGNGKRMKPLTKYQAEIALERIDNRDSEGRLTEFCFIFKQLLPKHIKSFDSDANNN